MAEKNINGRWEFDKDGNCTFVPSEQPSASGANNTSRTDGSYHYSYSYGGNRPGGNVNGTGSSVNAQKKSDTWHWVLIIGSFCVGAWPIGLVLLILKLTGTLDGKNKNAAKATAGTSAFSGANRPSQAHSTVAAGAASSAETGRAAQSQNTGTAGRSPYASPRTYRVPEGFSTHERKHQQEAARAEHEAAKKAKEDDNRHGLGHIKSLRIAGIVLTGLFGMTAISEIIDIIQGSSSLDGGISVLLSFLAAGIVMLALSASRSGKKKRYLKYLTMIGGRKRVSVSALAKTVGRSDKKVEKDLEDMLERGFFAQGYIDKVRGELVLDDWTEPDLDQEVPDTAPVSSAEAEENVAVRTLRQMRSLNNDIADPQMSDKIDRIEAITARIFKLQEEHPEKMPELRNFMGYYLPETLKLLQRYAELEAQQVEGENINAAMTQIEEMMDKVADAFEAQLDKLFESDAMDISADLKVMEQMLQQDGLAVEADPFA